MSNRNADVVVEKALFGWAFCFARRMIAAAVLAMAMFVRADGITLTRTDDEYVVTVESDFVASDATVYLVWGAKDAAGELQEWGSKRELGVVSPAGGSFRTSVEDIAPGSKVRALIANKIELLDGYVSMDVQGQYVNTGCPENETWKTELGLAVNGASGNWSSIVCGTIDQFTIGRENNNGGTIRAKADDTILKDFGNIVLKAGGLVIDTQGHNLNSPRSRAKSFCLPILTACSRGCRRFLLSVRP